MNPRDAWAKIDAKLRKELGSQPGSWKGDYSEAKNMIIDQGMDEWVKNAAHGFVGAMAKPFLKMPVLAQWKEIVEKGSDGYEKVEEFLKRSKTRKQIKRDIPQLRLKNPGLDLPMEEWPTFWG